jgi:hypothetical protein
MAHLDDPRWSDYRANRYGIDDPLFMERFGWRYNDYENYVYGDSLQDIVLDLAAAVIALEKRVEELTVQKQHGGE